MTSTHEVLASTDSLKRSEYLVGAGWTDRDPIWPTAPCNEVHPGSDQACAPDGRHPVNPTGQHRSE